MTVANMDEITQAITTAITSSSEHNIAPAAIDSARGSDSGKQSTEGRRKISPLSALPAAIPGWIPNKEDDEELAQPLPPSVTVDEVVLVHRWFCSHSAGLRAIFNYYDIPQRRVIMDLPHKTVLEGISDYKKTPILFFMTQQDVCSPDPQKASQGSAVALTLSPPSTDTGASHRGKRFSGFHGGLLPPRDARKMRNGTFTFQKLDPSEKLVQSSPSSSASTAKSRDETSGYQVNGSSLIFKSLFRLMHGGQSFRENLECGFRGASSLHSSCAYYPATVQDEEKWLSEALPLAVFTGIVHRGDSAESFARHMCGLDGGCIPEMKYACLCAVLKITDNVSKTHPYDFVEQMKTFMLRVRERNEIMRANRHEGSRGDIRGDDDTASTASSFEGATDTTTHSSIFDGDNDEQDATTQTTATTSSTLYSLGELEKERQTTTWKNRQKEEEPMFWSAADEPGLYDLKLYGAICVAIAIAEDKVRNAQPKARPKHPMSFRCWVHDDLIKAGALTWFRSVNDAYRTKRPRMEPIIPERAKNEVTRSFYGKG